MSKHYDAIVIGTGGIGSAALYELSRRGKRVLGLDRFPPAHDRGSSHGETRMIRLSYFEHPSYVPLLRRSYELWDELDPVLLKRSGVLYVGADNSESIAGVRLASRTYDLPIQESPTVAPGGPVVPEGLSTVLEPDAGFLPVEQCVKLHIERALLNGAEHRHGLSVLRWVENGDGVLVHTDQGEFRAKKLVITAGAWASQILEQLALPLTVLRKHLHWYEQGEMDFDYGYFVELDHGHFYGFPPLNGQVKVAEHSGGEEVSDPLNISREPDAEDSARIETFVRQCLPGLGARVRGGVCFYTMTPDGQFLVDKLPGSDRVAFVAGLSGHGFKFAPVLGEVLADLVLEGESRFDLEFLSLARFR